MYSFSCPYGGAEINMKKKLSSTSLLSEEPLIFCRSVPIADQRVLVKANDSVQLVCEAKGVEIILNFLCICIRRCILIRRCPFGWQMTHCFPVWLERCWSYSMPHICPGLQISCLQIRKNLIPGILLVTNNTALCNVYFMSLVWKTHICLLYFIPCYFCLFSE